MSLDRAQKKFQQARRASQEARADLDRLLARARVAEARAEQLRGEADARAESFALEADESAFERSAESHEKAQREATRAEQLARNLAAAVVRARGSLATAVDVQRRAELAVWDARFEQEARKAREALPAVRAAIVAYAAGSGGGLGVETIPHILLSIFHDEGPRRGLSLGGFSDPRSIGELHKRLKMELGLSES